MACAYQTVGQERCQASSTLIPFVAWSTKLWFAGFRSLRYMELCAAHKYRLPGGQRCCVADPKARGQAENEAIENLSQRYPTLISLKQKPHASLRTMQYDFHHIGDPPLRMQATKTRQRRRPREVFRDRAQTDAERARRSRKKRSRTTSTHALPQLHETPGDSENVRKKPSGHGR